MSENAGDTVFGVPFDAQQGTPNTVSPAARKQTRFAGYAALFDRVDRGGDVIRRGAFAGVTAPVPLYWQHDPRRPIGTVETVAEDARGLRVIGHTRAPVSAGTGLSFGYRVRAARAGSVRELHRVELIEVSLVRSPMQPLARVHAIEIEVPEVSGTPSGTIVPARAVTSKGVPETSD